MNTPTENQTQIHINRDHSGVEDSPTFMYMNNLSPNPIRSSLSTELPASISIPSFQFNFGSSQHATSQSESLLESGNKASCRTEGDPVQPLQIDSTGLLDYFDQIIPSGEASAEIPGKCVIEPSQMFNSASCCSDNQTSSVSELAGTSIIRSQCNSHLQEMSQIKRNNQGTYDSDNLNFGVGKSMIFNPPSHLEGLFGTQVSSRISFMDTGSSQYQVDYETENHLLQNQVSANIQPAEPTNTNLARTNSHNGNVNENVHNVLLLDAWTRCLDFPLMGGHNPDAWISTSALPQSNQEEATRKDNDDDVPNKTSSLSSATASKKSSHESLASTSSVRGIDVSDNVGQPVQYPLQASLYSANEEANPNSSKKKRHKIKKKGEQVGCKHCKCRNSKCVKLYCECFAAGRYCMEPCECHGCLNKPINESNVRAARERIVSRNPEAFTPKVIRSSGVASENGDKYEDSPASDRHIIGCNCKRSSCVKRYCECHQGGVGCSVSCRCANCRNTFGRKGGSALNGIKAETDKKRETNEKNVPEKISHSTEVLDNRQQIPTSDVPATPLHILRPLVQNPFSSESNPPRSVSFFIGSSSGSHTSQRIGQPNTLRPQVQLENQSESLPEDVPPNVLHGNHSPGNEVNIVSPNSERVACPNSDIGPSLPPQISRELILRTIRPFPSLNFKE